MCLITTCIIILLSNLFTSVANKNISRIDDTCSPDTYLSTTMIEVDKLLAFSYSTPNDVLSALYKTTIENEPPIHMRKSMKLTFFTHFFLRYVNLLIFTIIGRYYFKLENRVDD